MLRLILVILLASGVAEELRDIVYLDFGHGNASCDEGAAAWDAARDRSSGMPSVRWASRNGPIFAKAGCKNIGTAAERRVSMDSSAATRARPAEFHDVDATANLVSRPIERRRAPVRPGQPAAPLPREQPVRPAPVRPNSSPELEEPYVPERLAFCGGDGVGWIEVLLTHDNASFAGHRPEASTHSPEQLPQLGDVLTFSAARPATFYTGLGPCLLPEDLGCAPVLRSGSFKVAGRVRYAQAVSMRERWQLCVTREN